MYYYINRIQPVVYLYWYRKYCRVQLYTAPASRTDEMHYISSVHREAGAHRECDAEQ